MQLSAAVHCRMLAVVIALLAPAASAVATMNTLIDVARLPLSTSGNKIIDTNGVEVKLYCVNWYGQYSVQMAPDGLNKVTPAEVAATMVSQGFNCVRWPYGLDMLYQNRTTVPDPATTLAANPNLQTMTPHQIFDYCLDALANAGLLIILNNHVSSNGWCCDLVDGQGLWYTAEYSEELFFSSLSYMAARYASNPLVIGYDLRNEVRKSELGQPNWGDGGKTDWYEAAQTGGILVREQDPDMLIFVGGTFGTDWALQMFREQDLSCDIPDHPIHLVPALEGKVVYAPHSYVVYSSYGGVTAAYMAWYTILPIAAGVMILCLLPLCFASYFLGWFSHDEDEKLLEEEGSESSEGCCGNWARSICNLVCVGLLIPAIIVLGIIPLFLHGKCDTTYTFTAGVLIGIAIILCAIAMTVLCCMGIDCTTKGELSRKGVHGGGFYCCQMFCGLILAAGISVLAGWYAYYLMYENYDFFEWRRNKRYGYLLDDDNNAADTAPVWIGEVGTDDSTDWWENNMKYFKEKEMNWAYWPFNGEKQNWKTTASDVQIYPENTVGEPDSVDEHYGIMDKDMVTIRSNWKVEDLQSLINHNTAQGFGA